MPAPSLQSRLKKKGPFASAEQEVLLGVMHLSDLVENRVGRLLRNHGLTNSQYNVLRILRGEGKPLPSLEIAGRMIQVVPAITGLINRLEKQGLVERQPCEQDRRVVRVAITKPGLAVLRRIDKPLDALEKSLLAGVSAAKLAQLAGLLDRARRSVEEGANP